MDEFHFKVVLYNIYKSDEQILFQSNYISHIFTIELLVSEEVVHMLKLSITLVTERLRLLDLHRLVAALVLLVVAFVLLLLLFGACCWVGDGCAGLATVIVLEKTSLLRHRIDRLGS